MTRVRVSGFLQRQGKFLVVEHTKNDQKYYLLPGGGAEDTENLAISLQREFGEELNMEVTVGRLLLVAQTINPEKTRNILHMVFLVESDDDPEDTKLDERVTGFRCWELNMSSKGTFYPDILDHILDLVHDSTYNGVDFLVPEWV